MVVEEAQIPVRGRGERWVWVDVENTPHVLFLEPFINALRAGGYEVRVTAKPQSQTVALARARGLEVCVVGHGNLAGLSRKVAGGMGRALDLARWSRDQPGRPCVQIQSSRTASLAARLVGLAAVGLLDYERAIHWPMALGCRSVWFPDVLRGVSLPRLTRRVARFYPGLKENLYLDRIQMSRDEARHASGVAPGEFFVVSRPPAESAHYAAADGWRWWKRCLDRLLERRDVRVIVVPRDSAQGGRVQDAFGIDDGRLRLAGDVVFGPALVLAADLVVGGGGTMNREAAVLGTPAWSTFSGPRPGVDDRLATEGRLTWVHSERDLERALGSLGGRMAPRGPYPDGFRMIFEDVRRFLPVQAQRT